MTYVLGAILLYLLYRFITGFIWPVYKATSAVKKQFDEVRRNMEAADEFKGSHPKPNETPRFDPGGDYIPFEEIKDEK